MGTTETEVASGEGTEVPGCDLVIQQDVEIDADTPLADVERIVRIEGDLDIHDTTYVDLSFLGCLEEVAGSVRIRDNAVLESLEGAGRLTSIEPSGSSVSGALRIWNNEVLVSLEGLDSLQTLETLQVQSNPALSSIGLPSLEVVEWIETGGCLSSDTTQPAEGWGNNAKLTTLGGLPELRRVGFIQIIGQEALRDITAMTELALSGVEFGSAEFRINPQLALDQVEAFADAAGLETVDTCQLEDEPTICFCLPD